MEDTKIGFHINASIKLVGHRDEERAIRSLEDWWNEASDEEKLDAITVTDGQELAENVAYIEHRETVTRHVETVADY